MARWLGTRSLLALSVCLLAAGSAFWRADPSGMTFETRFAAGERTLERGRRVEASRVSVLGRLFVDSSAAGTNEDVNFDKTSVKSQALLGMNETRVLSGLYQREYRHRLDGVPILRNIPFVKMLFSNDLEADEVLSTIIFITPREPVLVNDERQRATREFVRRRMAYLRARDEGTTAIAEFKQAYPDWFKPADNYYATHLFLAGHSTVYREPRGEDLRIEDLKGGLLGVQSAAEARKEREKRDRDRLMMKEEMNRARGLVPSPGRER